MPSLLEPPAETEASPFADLIPKDLIGGESGGPAFQMVGAQFSAVPKAEVATPFADLIPTQPNAEVEKAVAETPSAADVTDTSTLHQIANSVRVFGAAAGNYIFDGIRGWENAWAKQLSHPTPEMVQLPPEAMLLPKEEQDRLEQQYVAEVQSVVPQHLANAEELRQRQERAMRNTPIDPGLQDTAPARLAAAAGEATMMGLESLVPGAGLPLMALHGAAVAEQRAKDGGASDAQAEAAAVRSAIGLGIFGGASKLAAVGVAAILPKLATEPAMLTKFLAQFVGQEAANEGSSRAIAAWHAAADARDGRKVEKAVAALGDWSLESGTLNTVYALMHSARSAGSRPKATPEAPVRPASEPEPAPAAMPGVVPETARSAEAAPAAAPIKEAPSESVDPKGQMKRPEEMTPEEWRKLHFDENEHRYLPPDYFDTHAFNATRDATTHVKTVNGIEFRQDQYGGVHAFDGDKNVGYGDGKAFVVSPEYQKLGIGTELISITKADDPLKPIGSKTAAGDALIQAYHRRLVKEASLRGEPEQAPSVEPNAASRIEPVVNDWTQATAPAPEEAGAALGIVAPGTAQLQAAGAATVGAAKALAKGATSLKEFHDFRRARLRWSARGQASTGEITAAAKQIQKAIPSPIRRAAITNWIQAGGDLKVLRQRAMASKNLLLRRGYEAALTLTPEEKAMAGKVRQTYDILRKRAEAHGIEINELDNYVNQIWRQNALKDFGTTFGGKKLSTSVRFAKKRYHESFFHGEQAGLVPETKDIAKLLPIYLSEVNNAINAKQFVAEMAKAKASDGRPLLSPRGGARIVEGEGDKGGAILTFPDRANAETSDYKVLDQPALHAWKWVGEENGKPIMLKGDLAVHPEAYSHLKNVLGQSAIREWYQAPSEGPLLKLGKGATKFLLDDVQQVGKATMLGFLSPFHQVQEGTHAIGHKVNPFGGLEKIDLRKPDQRDAAEHGVMLLPDRISAQQFREGLDGSSRNLVANVLGKAGGKIGRTIKEWSDGYQHYLFHEYIPSLKLKTYEHILERNQKRFEKELGSGAATIEQVKFLSAEQTNAAYGHLNYADMGRNPTLQHLAQVFLLAPDFLEARGRFAAQAVRGIASKTGREQLAAIATLAVTQFVLARILNKTIDDDYHWDEPFGVVVDGRRYTMRSVPEDIYKAFQDWRKFTTGRLSPLVGRGLLEGLSGINYRNEPTTIGETFTNILAGMMPLTLQPATRGLTETTRDNPVSPFEQLLGALGLHVSRFSPTSKVYSLAKDWQEANGIDRKRGLYPRSKYQQLRYALEDGDMDRARAAYDKLIADGEKKTTLGENFRESILSPFTGSLSNDRKFRSSLSAEDRKMFDAAVKRRHEILRRYQAMRTLSGR